MTDYFHLHIEKVAPGEYVSVACLTPDAIQHIPIPRTAFGRPTDGVRYCDMRQAAVSPLRAPVVDPVLPAGSTAGSHTRP